MPHVEVGAAFFRAWIIAVLWKVGIARAVEETGSVIERLRPGVRREHGEAGSEPLLESDLQAMVARTGARFLEEDAIKLGHGPWVFWLRAGAWLIDVAGREQFRTFRA